MEHSKIIIGYIVYLPIVIALIFTYQEHFLKMENILC